ncbi:MAG: hypothetical protein MHM6MM_003319 [Cercozoa sp. M6MM]
MECTVCESRSKSFWCSKCARSHLRGHLRQVTQAEEEHDRARTSFEYCLRNANQIDRERFLGPVSTVEQMRQRIRTLRQRVDQHKQEIAQDRLKLNQRKQRTQARLEGLTHLREVAQIKLCESEELNAERKHSEQRKKQIVRELEVARGVWTKRLLALDVLHQSSRAHSHWRVMGAWLLPTWFQSDADWHTRGAVSAAAVGAAMQHLDHLVWITSYRLTTLYPRYQVRREQLGLYTWDIPQSEQRQVLRQVQRVRLNLRDLYARLTLRYPRDQCTAEALLRLFQIVSKSRVSPTIPFVPRTYSPRRPTRKSFLQQRELQGSTILLTLSNHAHAATSTVPHRTRTRFLSIDGDTRIGRANACHSDGACATDDFDTDTDSDLSQEIDDAPKHDIDIEDNWEIVDM